MSRTVSSHPTLRVGRVAIAATLATIVGLVVTITAAAAIYFSPQAGQLEAPGLGPGYPDYGLRHRIGERPASQLDDYGIRCAVNGWCITPPGVPNP